MMPFRPPTGGKNICAIIIWHKGNGEFWFRIRRRSNRRAGGTDPPDGPYVHVALEENCG